MYETYSSWLVAIWTGDVRDNPLVYYALSWTDTRLDRRNGIRCGQHLVVAWHCDVGIVGPFAGFAVLETHGVHCSICFGELVDEHDLNQVAHFAAEGGSLSSLPCGLVAAIAERAVGVATVEGFEVGGVVVEERHGSGGDVQGNTHPVVPS